MLCAPATQPPSSRRSRRRPTRRRSRSGESPVVACASVGRLDLLNKLLSAGASADASSSSGLSALAAAAAVGHLACVEALLAAGAEVDAPCGGRSAPLSYAAQEAHRAVCVALLEAGADATAKDAYGTTPIEYAERHEGARRGDAAEFARAAAAAAAAQFCGPPLRNSTLRGALTRLLPLAPQVGAAGLRARRRDQRRAAAGAAAVPARAQERAAAVLRLQDGHEDALARRRLDAPEARRRRRHARAGARPAVLVDGLRGGAARHRTRTVRPTGRAARHGGRRREA